MEMLLQITIIIIIIIIIIIMIIIIIIITINEAWIKLVLLAGQLQCEF